MPQRTMPPMKPIATSHLFMVSCRLNNVLIASGLAMAPPDSLFTTWHIPLDCVNVPNRHERVSFSAISLPAIFCNTTYSNTCELGEILQSLASLNQIPYYNGMNKSYSRTVNHASRTPFIGYNNCKMYQQKLKHPR